ncbi:MAG: ABC transporter substrate-binding protein, partial [Propionicimonas sp.]
RTQLTSGTAPDVFSVFPGNGSPTAVQVLGPAGKFLYDLSDRPWIAKMPKNLIESGSYDGKVYTALYGVNGIGAIYNTGALETAGLTAPTTWSEVLKLCSAAKADGKVAYALGAQDQWVTQLINYALTATLVYGPDPSFSKKQADGSVTFANSGWTTSFEKYQQMTDAGCFQADPLSTDYATTQKMVASGKALAAINGNWMIGEIKKAAPSGKFKLFPFPATDDTAATYMPVAAGAGFSVNSKTKNAATALAFVDFAVSPEGLGIAVPIQGGLPPYPTDTVTVDDSLEYVSSYMADGKAAAFPDQGWPNAKVQSEHLIGVQNIFAGKATPADVMAKMQAAFDKGN